MPVVPARAAPARARSVPMILLGAIVIAALAGAAWWLSGTRNPASVVAVDGPGSAASGMTPTVAPDPGNERRRRADGEIANGDAATAAGDAASATAAYSRALAIDPTDLEAALKLGRTRENQDDYDGAEAAYAQAMKIAPDNPAPWLERGASRAEQGRFADAVADYTRAIALQGDDPTTYFNRGAANEGQKKVAAARADYNSALGLKPDFIPALLARADAVAVQLHMAEEELADLTALRRGRVRLAAYPSAAATSGVTYGESSMNAPPGDRAGGRPGGQPDRRR